jgi:uncharacterized membrane protein YdbT with pleckstrin-like domain
MALTKCPDCGGQVSTEAKACPTCGRPPSLPKSGELLMEVRPSWLGLFWYLLFFFLIIPLLVALYKRHSFIMRIYTDRVSIEEGFLAKEFTEFFIKDIRSIDVTQSMMGRIFDVGNVTISTAATVDAAEVAEGVPHPAKIRDLLISSRQRFNA